MNPEGSTFRSDDDVLFVLPVFMVMTVLLHDVDERLHDRGIYRLVTDLEYADDTLEFGVTVRVLDQYLSAVKYRLGGTARVPFSSRQKCYPCQYYSIVYYIEI